MTSGDKVVLCCPRFEILGKLHTRESGQVRKVRAKTSKDLLLVVLVIQSAASQAQPLSHPSVLLQLVDVIAMTSFGSLVFCNDCGNLLDASTGVKQVTLKCNVCGTTCKDTSSKVVVTRSKPSDFPSTLRAKRSQVQTLTEDDLSTEATIRQTCDKCGREEVRYYTQQLRSADEGTTVFYTCDCGNKWNTNN